MEPIRAETGLTPLQLACQWNLAHPAVECVVPTLIQEAGPGARPIEDKRRELAGLPPDLRLRPDQVAAIARDRRQPRLDATQGREPRARGPGRARTAGA